ncbi:MAG: DNA photolyase family protein [Candidatus Eremiobacteraeota bacterium]|nr:DNA photolyase family protein [Candidatus Eremiobacteraeota bacterium]
MQEPSYSRSVVWLRRDLRLADNAALAEAARRSREICIAFNIDPVLLSSDRVGAPIVQTFFEALGALRLELRKRGSDLALLEGDFARELLGLAKRIDAHAIFYNEDYDPAAIARDAEVNARLRAASLDVHTSLDHVYYAAGEVRNGDGSPYKIFTPFRNKWRRMHAERPAAPIPSLERIAGKLMTGDAISSTLAVPTPESYHFSSSPHFPRCSEPVAGELLDTFLSPGGAAERYADDRNMPQLDATSHLSPQLRAGTIGIRTCFQRAFEAAERPGGGQIEKWIDELIWREFYQSILKSYPRVANGPFIEAAAAIEWDTDRSRFERWCNGVTGYPIVDAAMRQLNERGWMHNRLRMIAASFLSKDLLLNWQWGERYFEAHLADADLAQNNGGWQWAASTGTDAVPYFRVFNPVLQSKTFDGEGDFIRSMVPELKDVPGEYVHEPWEMPPLLQEQIGCRIGVDYPAPIVDHGHARNRAIAVYSAALGAQRQRQPK